MSPFIALRRCILAVIYFSLVSPMEMWGGLQVWVAGNGTDTGNCPYEAPCQTFDYASYIVFSSTTNGEVDAMDSGVYGGAQYPSFPSGFGQSLTFNQPKTQTIDGGAGNIASIFQGTISINNLNEGDIITLRNLVLNGDNFIGPALQITGNGTVIIENCKFYGYGSGGAISIAGGQDHIIADTIVESNEGDAITVSSGNSISLRNVAIKNNSGNALNVSAGSTVDISNSVLTQNTEAAILASGTDTTINCVNNVLTSNGAAIGVGTEALVRISNNDIYNNSIFIDYADETGQVVTANNNRTGSNGSTPASPSGSIIIQ